MLNKQLIKQWLQQTTNQTAAKRYLWALALSILLHIWLVKGFDLTLPSPATVSLVEVRLVAAKKPVATEKKQETKPNNETPKPEPTPVEKQPETAVEENLEPAKPVNPLAEAEPAPETQVETPPETPQAQEEKTMAKEIEPEVKPTETQEAAGKPIPALSLVESGPPYTFLNMHYDVFKGVEGAKIGKANIMFEALPEKRYIINSVTEPMGIAKFFVDGALTQTSNGAITEAGLQPDDYTYIFAEKADKTKQAIFDWNVKQIKLRNNKGEQMATLETGSQDLLSFMFQFMYEPPLQTMQIWIADGKRLRLYDYIFEGEETLKTEMGDLQTLHIANVKATSDEKTELWLAVDYRNLPVKIRKTEKDGSVIEQVITSLSTQVQK